MKSFPWWRGALGVFLVLGTIASGLGGGTATQVQQQGTPVQEAFASVWDHVVIVYGYDPTNTASPWVSYDTTAPPFANRLQTVEPLAGYFLFLNEDDAWEVGNQRRQLYRGWNLVGWPGMAGPGLPPMPPTPPAVRPTATPVVSDEGGPITAGVAVNGRVNPSGDTDDWTFSGRAGQVVTIAMDVAMGTSSWDPIVDLRDPSGSIETSDDDAGEGSNALIWDWPLRQSGVYTIRARGYGSSTGAYTLLLTTVTPTPTAVLTAAGWSGRWDWHTTVFSGTMELSQTGSTVTGTYAILGYTYIIGRINGTVSGNVLRGGWSESVVNEAGRFEWTLAADGNSFSGTFGNGASATDGGTWTGFRAD